MIKILGLIFMTLDHIGVVLFPNILLMQILGRLAFPFFAWGISRGYQYTKNFRNYLLRILLLALVSQIPYNLLFETDTLNVCFTFTFALLALKIYDTDFNGVVKIISIIILMLLTLLLKMEYSIYGILSIILFTKIKRAEYMILSQCLLTLVSTLIYRFDPIQLFAMLSFFLILILEELDFKINRTFQYIYYPLHLIVLLIIKNGGLKL